MFRSGGASTLKRSLFAVACLCVLVLVPVAGGSHTPAPTSVGLPGNFGDELGCPGDWQPDCSVTKLAFDTEDRVWQGAFDVPAGSWEYKAALNDSWDENYGLHAQQGGANIALTLNNPSKRQVLLRPRYALDHGQPQLGDRDGARQLPERDRVPGRLAA